jgi:tRNA(Ile2) C34 agmatinyltransferase TiaS
MPICPDCGAECVAAPFGGDDFEWECPNCR